MENIDRFDSVCVCDFDECIYIVIWPLLIYDNIIYTTM